MTLQTTAALAHVNAGRWIALCPREYCGNAERLKPGQTTFHCSNCHLIAPVDWPADAEDIEDALSVRPVPQTRNWYPRGHPLAVRSNTPHGESVADLLAENEAHGLGVT